MVRIIIIGLQRVGLNFESIIVIIIITSMHCIYNYIPETNHVPTAYAVAAILLLQYMIHIMQFPTINPLYSTPVLPAVCAVPSVAVLFSSGTSCFPVTLLKYCLSDFVWVPVAPIVSGISLLYIHLVIYIYYKVFIIRVFSAAFLIALLLLLLLLHSTSSRQSFSVCSIDNGLLKNICTSAKRPAWLWGPKNQVT